MTDQQFIDHLQEVVGAAVAERERLCPVADFPWLHRSGILRCQIVGESADTVSIVLYEEAFQAARRNEEPTNHTLDKETFYSKYMCRVAGDGGSGG